MRFFLPAILSLGLVGAAFAQAMHVTIEDDVSHANAIACAGLRTAQVKAAPTALLAATQTAWMKSIKAAGHDPAMTDREVADEAARLASASPAALKSRAQHCEAFEIR